MGSYLIKGQTKTSVFAVPTGWIEIFVVFTSHTTSTIDTSSNIIIVCGDLNFGDVD